MIVPKYEFGIDDPVGGEIDITGHCDGYHGGCVGGSGFIRDDELDIPIYLETES